MILRVYGRRQPVACQQCVERLCQIFATILHQTPSFFWCSTALRSCRSLRLSMMTRQFWMVFKLFHQWTALWCITFLLFVNEHDDTRPRSSPFCRNASSLYRSKSVILFMFLQVRILWEQPTEQKFLFVRKRFLPRSPAVVKQIPCMLWCGDRVWTYKCKSKICYCLILNYINYYLIFSPVP